MPNDPAILEPVTPPVADPVVPEPVKADDKPVDLAEIVKAAMASVAAMADEIKALKAEREADKAAAVDANLTDAQKAAAKVAELEARVANQEQAAKDAARSNLLSQYGVDPAYQQFAPDVDARDPKGKATLEKWAADHPRLTTKPVQHQSATMNLNGKPLSKLIDPAAMQASFDSIRAIGNK